LTEEGLSQFLENYSYLTYSTKKPQYSGRQRERNEPASGKCSSEIFASLSNVKVRRKKKKKDAKTF
jgi:hypothetical protein